MLKISFLKSVYLTISLFFSVVVFCQDIVTYVGKDIAVSRSGSLTDVLDLGNGKYAILGADKTLDWIPSGTPTYEIAFPTDKIDNDLGTGKYCFIIIIDTILLNKSIDKVFYIEKNKVENFRFIKHTGVPGSPVGAIYISGDRASTLNPGYFIGKLDQNFVTGNPTKFDWVFNVKAAGMMFSHQPWDVGGDGKVVFGEGTSFSTSWAAVRRLKADGTNDVVPRWRVHYKIDGTEVVDTIAPPDAVKSCTTIKIDGRGCIQSMNLADYNLITSDGNGGWKKGKYPFDIFFKGDINGTWDVSGQGGYTGYRKGANSTGGIGGITIDKRNNDMFIGFNFQSKLPDGSPDFEPAVMKMDKDGRLIWWSRMYTESTDPACTDKTKLFTSSPDQYVDGLAIDYFTNNLVVNARCHGNNVKNFWTSNNAFQKSFTGTNGNIHISWLGKLKLLDGTFTSGTYVAGYNWKAPKGAKYTDPNLAGWANHNNGAVNDLNTTKLHPNTLKVDNKGGVVVIGTAQRIVTTKNAYQEQDSIFDNAAPWSDFVRVFSSDFSKVPYSSIVHSSFVSGGQFYNGSDINLRGVFPLPTGALVVGYNKADPANVFNVDCRNVPLGWGQDGINGPTPFLAKLTGEISPRYNNQTRPGNPELTTGGTLNSFNGLDQVYLPDGSSVSAFQTESPAKNLLWNVDLFNGDSILGLHRNSAMVKWNASGRKEWHIDFDYGYDAPPGHDHHYPVVDKPFAPGGDTRFRKIVVDSQGGIYLAGSVWGGPDSVAGQPKFLYPKSFVNNAYGGKCDSIPWPCFQKPGDPNHLKRVALSFILKYNNQGLFQWAKTYWGDTKNDQGGIDIALTNGGNVVGNDTLLVMVSLSHTVNGLVGGQLVGGIGKASYNVGGTQLRVINNGAPGNPDNSSYNANDRFSIIKHGNRFFVLKRNMGSNLKVDGISVTGGGSSSSDVFIYELNPKTMFFFPRYTKITLTNTQLNIAWSDYFKSPANLHLIPRASSDGRAAFYLVGNCLSDKPIGQKAEMTITGSNISEPKRVIVEKQTSDTLSGIPFIVMLKENTIGTLTRNLIYDGITVKLEDQIFDFNKKLGKEKINWRLDGIEALVSANSNSLGELYMMLRMKNNLGYKGIVRINNQGNYFPPEVNDENDIAKGSHIMYFKVMPNGTTTYLTKPEKLTYEKLRPHKVNFDLSDNPTFVSVIGDENAELKLGPITINGNKSGFVFAKMDKSNPSNWLYANTFRYWNSINYPPPGLSNPLKFCDVATVADLYNAVKPETKPVDVHFYKKITDQGSAKLVDMAMPLQNDSVYYTEQWWISDSIMSKRIGVTVKIFKTPVLNKSTITNCPTCQSLSKEGKIKLFGATADEGVVYWSKDKNFSSYEVGDTVQFIQNPSTEAVKKYYYKAVNGGKCHSEIDSITITLMPSLKITNDTICGAGQLSLKAKPVFWERSGAETTATVSEVNASGTVRWYDAPVGGNLLQTNVVTTGGTSEYKPNIADGEMLTVWAEVASGSCGAYERYKVEAYSFGTPVTTKISNDTIICGVGSLKLKAESSKPLSQVHWYADAACTNLLFQGNELEIPSQNPPLSRTYYAKASYNGRCEGNVVQYKVEWRLAAGIKSVEHDTICGAGVATLKANAVDPAQTIRWYDSEIDGTVIATGNTFNPNVATNTSFFAEADNGICGKSTRVEVKAVVKNLATITGITFNSEITSFIETTIGTSFHVLPIVSGLVNSYALSGILPTGLTFNPITGEISGTPSVSQPSVNYVLKAINDCGEVSTNFSIKVNNIPPVSLSYPSSPVIATKGVTVINAVPTISGGEVVSYSITPALPAGVSLNTTTGVISGTPTVLLTTTVFTITASNSGGSTSGTFTLTVIDPEPGTFIYNPASIVATKGVTVINAVPTISGGAVDSYSITPALPAGVSLNTTTGVISGTPTVLLTTTIFTITASNTGGSTSGTFTLTVNDVAPSGLSYASSPVIATKGVTVINAVPTISGGEVVSYSITPALPAGVSLNTTTGVISGTPTVLLTTTVFTITASNSGGSTSGTFTLTVIDPFNQIQSPQTLCFPAFVSDIKIDVPQNVAIGWWTDPIGGVQLTNTTPLESGKVYYIEINSETVNSGIRYPVEVHAAPPIINTIISNDEVSFVNNDGKIKVETEPIENCSFIWKLPDGYSYEGVNFEFPVEQYLDSGKCVVSLTVINNYGCTKTLKKDIWVLPVKIPNTFTPNNDGINDIFMKGYMLEIYNRNGIKIHEGMGWDGTHKGHTVPNGTYFYALKLGDKNHLKIKTGYITVSKQ